MTKDEIIKKSRELNAMFNVLREEIQAFPHCREIALAVTKLDEMVLWFSVALSVAVKDAVAEEKQKATD